MTLSLSLLLLMPALVPVSPAGCSATSILSPVLLDLVVSSDEDPAVAAAETIATGAESAAWDAIRELCALEKKGLKAHPRLIEVLEDESADAVRRGYAALGLGAAGAKAKKAVKPLVAVLESATHESIAVPVRMALAQIGAASVKPALALTLSKRHIVGQWGCGIVYAIGEEGGKSAAVLADLLKEETSYYLYPIVIETLKLHGRSGKRALDKRLERLMKREVKRRAYGALPRISYTEYQHLLGNIYHASKQGKMVLGLMDFGLPALDREPGPDKYSFPDSIEDFNKDGNAHFTEALQMLGLHMAKMVSELQDALYSMDSLQSLTDWNRASAPILETCHLLIQITPTDRRGE